MLSFFGVIYGLAALAGLFFAFCALVCSCFKHMFEFTSLSATDFQVTVLPGLNPYSAYLPTRQEPFLLADEAEEDISNGKGDINVLE